MTRLIGRERAVEQVRQIAPTARSTTCHVARSWWHGQDKPRPCRRTRVGRTLGRWHCLRSLSGCDGPDPRRANHCTDSGRQGCTRRYAARTPYRIPSRKGTAPGTRQLRAGTGGGTRDWGAIGTRAWANSVGDQPCATATIRRAGMEMCRRWMFPICSTCRSLSISYDNLQQSSFLWSELRRCKPQVHSLRSWSP